MVKINFPRGLLQFYKVIYQMVDDPLFDSIISWSSSNKSFVIWDEEELIRRQIFVRFYGPNYSKFFSMLKLHGFGRVRGSERLEFGDDNFVRGKPELLTDMQESYLRSSRKRDRARRAAERLQLNHLRI